MSGGIHHAPLKYVGEVQRGERLAQHLLADIQVGHFVALHGLVQKRDVQQDGESSQQQQFAPALHFQAAQTRRLPLACCS